MSAPNPGPPPGYERVAGPDEDGYWFPVDHPKGGDVPCPDCGGSGRGAGPDRKVESPVSPGLSVWEPPRCERCNGVGVLSVTISGDSDRYYLSDDDGRIVSTHATLDEARRVISSGERSRAKNDSPRASTTTTVAPNDDDPAAR